MAHVTGVTGHRKKYVSDTTLVEATPLYKGDAYLLLRDAADRLH